jgi:hypothetical protein
MPPGLLVTGPLPVPYLNTVRVLGGDPALNTAVVLRACDSVTLHVDEVPLHAPDQPAK